MAAISDGASTTSVQTIVMAGAPIAIAFTSVHSGDCVCCYKNASLDNLNYCKPCHDFHVTHWIATNKVFRRTHFHRLDSNWKNVTGTVVVSANLT